MPWFELHITCWMLLLAQVILDPLSLLTSAADGRIRAWTLKGGPLGELHKDRAVEWQLPINVKVGSLTSLAVFLLWLLAACQLYSSPPCLRKSEVLRHPLLTDQGLDSQTLADRRLRLDGPVLL